MRLGKVSRRRFLLASIVCAHLALVADAKWLEPDWVKIRRIRLGSGKPPPDVHHKGVVHGPNSL